MTESEREKKKSTWATQRGQMLFCVMGTVALILAFVYSEETISAMSLGMKLCVNTVIPSLFPFMVLSELFVSSGAARFFGKLFGAPLSKLFGVSDEGSIVWLLSIFCGFPIGVRSAISLYERGRISHGELEHLCAFCNGPSSAFLISAVGSSLFGSKRFGILLYAAHIISSFFIGVCSRFYFSGKGREYCSVNNQTRKIDEKFSVCFSRAVTSSASSMLFICAFVIFFSALTGFLRIICSALNVSVLLQTLMFGFFEMTGGAVYACQLPPYLAVATVAAITGWSGLSVHFQLIGIVGSSDVPFVPYVLCKVFSSLLCCGFTLALVKMFGRDVRFDAKGSVASLLIFEDIRVPLLILSVFFLACAMLYLKARKSL